MLVTRGTYITLRCHEYSYGTTTPAVPPRNSGGAMRITCSATTVPCGSLHPRLLQYTPSKFVTIYCVVYWSHTEHNLSMSASVQGSILPTASGPPNYIYLAPDCSLSHARHMLPGTGQNNDVRLYYDNANAPLLVNNVSSL